MTDPWVLWILIPAFAVLAGAGFLFALAETALFSLEAWKVRRMSPDGESRESRLARLLHHPQDTLATIVLGNTFANAGLVLVGTRLAFEERVPIPFGVSMFLLLLFLLVVSELIPKALAVRSPEKLALRLAGPLLALQGTLRPVLTVAEALNGRLLHRLVPRGLHVQPDDPDAEMEELLEMSFQHGALRESEKETLLEILNLDRRAAHEVMTPRTQVAMIDATANREEMVAAAREHRHRYLPMYDDETEDIVAILDTHLLLINPGQDPSEAILSLPSFVPESMNCLELLRRLRSERRGPAIVVDEYGGTAGIVTAEDILEAVVGDIRSESQPEDPEVVRLGPGRWRVQGTARIEDFQEYYPDLRDAAEVETMGGLLTARLEAIPRANETVVVDGLRLTAESTDERRVLQLLVETVRPARN